MARPIIPANDENALHEALEDARALVNLGVPVFAGRLTSEGEPYALDPRWKSWQKTRANTRPIDRYAKGEALGAVTGTAFDVIDIDPRNGGRFSFKKMADELGDDGPEIYWEVKTSSGGRHLYIAPLGIGTHPAFMKGLDLKAEGGFVFIPPTIRPSKADENAGQRVAYQALRELGAPVGEGHVDAVRDFITGQLAAKRGSKPTGRGRKRVAIGELEGACLEAGRGEQRPALLALADEWARVTGDDDLIVDRIWSVARQMKAFDKSWPWSESDILHLLHRDSRRPTPDATRDEMKQLSGPMTPLVTAKGLQPFSDVTDRLTRWAWLRYLAIGDGALLDGDAGKAKSLLTLDLAARFTTARPMPGESESIIGQGNVLLLSPEDRAEVIKARLRVHGADMARVFKPEIQAARKGKSLKAMLDGALLTFPDKIDTFRRWIESYDIGMVIVDPVTAFLSEKINSGIDSSVRSALEPFTHCLQQNDATALLIRHLNKKTGGNASYRGGGSVAFGAVARIHLIVGELPPGAAGDTGAQYAIAQLKNNHLERPTGVGLAYRVTDSDQAADDDGNMVPMIDWCGEVDVNADILANGTPARHGPAPTTQPLLAEFLEACFTDQDTWPVKKIKAEMEAGGFSPRDNKTVDKVRAQLGIHSVAVRRRGQPGVGQWVWTTNPPKGRPSD